MSVWIESLLQEVTAVTPAGLAIVALAGLVVGIAPSSFPMLSVAAAFAGRHQFDMPHARYEGLWLSLAFALGIVSVDAIIGALFGSIGFGAMRLLVMFLAPAYFLLAIVLAAMGLALLHVISIRIPVLTPSPRPARGIVGAYQLGLPFGLSTCPACTPLLFPVVVTATASADPITGAALLATFGLFRGVPIVVAGTAAGVLKHTWRAWGFIRWFERVCGVLLLAAAVFYFLEALIYAGWLSPFT